MGPAEPPMDPMDDSPPDLPQPADAAHPEPALDAPAIVSEAAPSATEPVRQMLARIQAETGRVLVGMEKEVRACLGAALAGGHVLLEGPPGVAKTLLVHTLAQALGDSYNRIQFTPDLMPADVTGTAIFHPSKGEFQFSPGPIFAQILLCDEINRAPAKTQSAMLEAMQEGTVTVDGEMHPLPSGFSVFATMNPIEHEGTYPLPEAQLDRFLFKVKIGYPAPAVEAELLAASHARAPGASPAELGVRTVLEEGELARARQLAMDVDVRQDLPDYVVRLFQATRSSPSLVLGASPRAGVMLLRAAKAHAALLGQDYVTPDDIKAVFLPALRHRVCLDPSEEIEGVTTDDVLQRILDHTEVPR